MEEDRHLILNSDQQLTWAVAKDVHKKLKACQVQYTILIMTTEISIG